MISIHIPKNGNAPDITKELNSANNIKNRVVKHNTITGLHKIAHYL